MGLEGDELGLGLGPAQVRLAYARCKQAQNPELYNQGYPNITYDRNSFSRKHVCSLFTCKDT
jgi:hypothetical protein